MIGLRFNIKERLSRYKDFHYSDKTVVRLSYLYNGNPIQVRRWLYLETALVSRLSYLYNGNPISEKTVFILNPVAFVNKHGRTLLYSTHEREIEINTFNHSMNLFISEFESRNRGGGGGGGVIYHIAWTFVLSVAIDHIYENITEYMSSDQYHSITTTQMTKGSRCPSKFIGSISGRSFTNMV